MFFFKKRREEADRKAAQEAQERAAREAAERKAQEEAAKKAKLDAEDAALRTAKKTYEKAQAAFFSDNYKEMETLYEEAFRQGYYPAGSSLCLHYMKLAKSECKELPYYNKTFMDHCYKKAYSWAVDTLKAAERQAAKRRGLSYEKNMFVDDTEYEIQNMRLILAEMDLYRQGFGRGPEEAAKNAALAGEFGDRIKNEIEEARNAEFYIDLEKKGLWTLDSPVPQDLPEGITDFGRYFAALSYRDGTWSEKNPAKAFKLFQVLADEGYYGGMLALAGCYENGIGTAPDTEEALRLYISASKSNNWECWTGCANALLKARQQEDWVKAAIERMTKDFYAPAMLVYAKMLEEGFGAEKDPEKAIEVATDPSTLFKLYISDQKGHTRYIPAVMDFLTEHYRKMLREGADPKYLYESSANYSLMDVERHGSTERRIAILNVLLETSYKEKAETALYAFYTYSNKNRWKESLTSEFNNANYCVFYGRTKIPEEAFRLGLIFAEKGDARAMYQTGIRYCWGIGTEKDLDQAEFWLKKAQEKGCPGADTALANMDEPEDLLESNCAVTDVKDHLAYAKALHLGRVLAFDEGKALKEFAFAAEKGNVEALEYLMDFYYSGPDFLGNRKIAFDYAKQAGNAGSARGFQLCGKICEGLDISSSKYAYEYYLLAEQRGSEEAGVRARELIEAQKHNYEKGLEAYKNGKYYNAYHLWYPCFKQRDERVVLPAARILSERPSLDTDDFAWWVFTRAYELGEMQYAGDAARAFWFSPGHSDENLVIEWSMKDPALTGDEYYILAKACDLADRYSDYIHFLDKAAAAGCYMAQYELAIYYIQQGDRAGYIWAESLAKSAAKNPNQYDPSGVYGPGRVPTPEQLYSRLRETDITLTREEEKEAFARAEEYEERQRNLAQQRAAMESASSNSPGTLFGNPFENYGLVDKDGNIYNYDPATGRITGSNIDGAISLSPDEMHRRAAEHALNKAVDDFLNR